MQVEAKDTWISSDEDRLVSWTANFSVDVPPVPDNDSFVWNDEADYPLVYRVVATILHALILVLGVAGNIVLILVARRTKSLQTPTYCYLVSLVSWIYVGMPA